LLTYTALIFFLSAGLKTYDIFVFDVPWPRVDNG